MYARPKESQSPPPQPLRSVSSTVSPGYSERPPPPIPTQHTVPSTSLPVSIAKNDDPPPVPRKPPVPTTISVPSALSPTLSPQGVQMQLPSGVGQVKLSLPLSVGPFSF